MKKFLLIIKLGILFAPLLFGMVAVTVMGKIQQNQVYHDFADKRSFFGIPNTMDVISNVLFSIVGVLGLYKLNAGRHVIEYEFEKWGYAIFWFSEIAIGFGSAYYHYNPCDETLLYDRLPLGLGFGAITILVLGDFVSAKLSSALLFPYCVLSVLSVVYWNVVNDLGPYFVIQLYTVLVVPLVYVLFHDKVRYSRGSDWMIAVGFYAIAKVTESNDAGVYEFTLHFMSGHTMKHVLAAMGTYWLLKMVIHRRATTVKGINGNAMSGKGKRKGKAPIMYGGNGNGAKNK